MGIQTRDRLINTLLMLLICLATLILAQMLWQLASGYADLILLFVLGWLVSFILNPIVHQLSHHPVPSALEPLLESTLGPARSKAIMSFGFSRTTAVVIVYLVLVLFIVMAVALLAPTAITQLTLLASHLPDYMKAAPTVSDWAQTELEHLGIQVNVRQSVDVALGGLQSYAATIIRNALQIFTSLLSLLANLFFVLILGFLMTLDGPRLRRAILGRVPSDYHAELRFFFESVGRTFGGFLRGQLIQAFLVAVGTAVAMTVFGLSFVLIVSLFAGLFMLIPLVGPYLALIPPVMVALLQASDTTLWLIIVLFVYQFVVVNMLMPRILSDSVGLHPLLVFASILVSVKIAGFWGAFFGIPVAGVLWAMGLFLFEKWQREHGTSEASDLTD